MYLKCGLAPYVLSRFLEVHHSPNICLNYSYLPILICPNQRQSLLDDFSDSGVVSRIYFDRLIPDFPSYEIHPELWRVESCSNLSVANQLAKSVVTLPLHDGLSWSSVSLITSIVKKYTPQAFSNSFTSQHCFLKLLLNIYFIALLLILFVLLLSSYPSLTVDSPFVFNA